MKIVYIAYSPVPSAAANSVHVMKMAQALAKAKHKVTLLTPEYKRKEPAHFSGDLYEHYGVSPIFRYIKIPFINLPKCRTYSHLFFMTALILLTRPDFVYTRDLQAAAIAVSLGFQVIFERHDALETQTPDRIDIFKKLAAHKNLRALVVISEALKQEIIRKFSVPEEKIIVAHDAADPLPENLQPTLPPNGKIKIGYTGHLYQGRGIDIILTTARRMPEYEFHIVGGHANDVAFWRNGSIGLENLFFHGHVAPSHVAEYLASFDILLAPYQEKVAVSGGGAKAGGDTARWMSPLKIFEYMSSGKAMICSDIPVLREVLRDGGNCLLCPPADADAWVEAIRKLAKDPELADKLAQQALSDFHAQYSWDARVKYILGKAFA